MQQKGKSTKGGRERERVEQAFSGEGIENGGGGFPTTRVKGGRRGEKVPPPPPFFSFSFWSHSTRLFAFAPKVVGGGDLHSVHNSLLPPLHPTNHQEKTQEVEEKEGEEGEENFRLGASLRQRPSSSSLGTYVPSIKSLKNRSSLSNKRWFKSDRYFG